MSSTELDRLQVLELITAKRITQKEAGKQLQLSTRQIKRIYRDFRENGYRAVVSKKRGKIKNRAYPDSIKQYVISIVKEKYHDFGPTLIAEKLSEIHDIHLSRETIRQWLIGEEIWATRTNRTKRSYQPRYRRECYGELIQLDGSEHRWFEDRGPVSTLLVYVDDATSKIMELRFTKSESTFDYMYSTRRYLERHGKPVAFYSDKHTVFRVNHKNAVSGTGMTQFGRAMHDLNIDIICANSSQAKGRVERMNKTLQDRLIKEMRLLNICNNQDANDYVPDFIEKYNSKFGKPPLNPKDIHREFTSMENLDDIFSWQEERSVTNNLTFQYDRVVYMIKDNVKNRDLRKKKVRIYDYCDGTIDIKYKGESLPYKTYNKVTQVKQSEIVNNKRLGEVLQWAKDRQKEIGFKRSKSAPKRAGQAEIIKDIERKRNLAVKVS